MKKAHQGGVSARPPEPKGPPRPRPQLVEATRAPVVKEEPEQPGHRRASGPVRPESPEGSVDYRGGRSSESDPEGPVGSASPEREHHQLEVEAGVGVGASGGPLGPRVHQHRSRSPAAPRAPRRRGPRPGHRGGVKHQRHYRNLPSYQDPAGDRQLHHRAPYHRGVREEDL